MRDLNERLQRLIDSPMCDALDADQHREELKDKAKELLGKTRLKGETRFFKALSDEKRLGIVKLLSIRDMCLCELMIALDVSQPNLSHHIKILENAGVVERLKKGKWVFCTLSDRELVEKMASIGLL